MGNVTFFRHCADCRKPYRTKHGPGTENVPAAVFMALDACKCRGDQKARPRQERPAGEPKRAGVGKSKMTRPRRKGGHQRRRKRE